jgi:hypothetical protein
MRTVEEAQAARRELEHLILCLIQQFERNYSVALDNIYHSQDQTISDRLRHTIGVRITVNI